MRKLQILLISAFFSAQCVAQSIQNFKNLESQGDIPELFVSLLSNQIRAEVEKLTNDESISKRSASEFSTVTNYKLQQLVHSGRVLYGDPLSNYANKIIDLLDEHSENDYSDIVVYTFKSNEVNAFATHQGVVFLTVGLWGQLANEAQLAYVLAHEISHIQKKHNQLSYHIAKNF